MTLSNIEKLGLIDSLATMLSAGIPIMDSVESLIAESKGNQKKILLKLKDDLNQGKNISESLEKYPDAFDRVTVNVIKAAEEAGTLDKTLKDLGRGIKQEMEFSDKVKAATLYPLVILATFSAVMLVILTFVVPRVALAFSKLKVKLPLPTKILIFLSNLLRTYYPVIIVCLILLIAVGIYLYKTKKRYLQNAVFSLPYLSGLGREIDITRFTGSMALLLSSGIPISEALEYSKNVVVKREVYTVVDYAKNIIDSGQNLSVSFKKYTKVIPPIMIRITEAGEKSGTLDKSMKEISEYFDEKVNNSLKNLAVLIEPMLLIVVGVFVGAIMLSIIAPIYGMIGQISVR